MRWFLREGPGLPCLDLAGDRMPGHPESKRDDRLVGPHILAGEEAALSHSAPFLPSLLPLPELLPPLSFSTLPSGPLLSHTKSWCLSGEEPESWTEWQKTELMDGAAGRVLCAWPVWGWKS